MGKSFQEKESMHNALSTPTTNSSILVTDRSFHDAKTALTLNSYAQNIPTSTSLPNSDSQDRALQDAKMTLHWSLIDPLVKDLSPNSRYYLFHFADQLCEDLVLYDLPGRNPIRDLIPATSEYPLLLQIMIANSAFHIYNLSREPINATIQQESPKLCLATYCRSLQRFRGPVTSSYRDALVAKQHALHLLNHSLGQIEESNVDYVLASVLLFINFELIGSGKNSWKVHADGAQRLINFLGSLGGDDEVTPLSSMSFLRKSLISDSLVYCILGSTLTYSSTPNVSLHDSIALDAILEYAESNNFVSCPAHLLRIMLKSSELSEILNDTPVFAQELSSLEQQVKLLVRSAQKFDPFAWASSFQLTSPYEEVMKRMHMASAHRSAVCLYVVRVLPDSSPLIRQSSTSAIVDIPGLVSDIIHHLSFIHLGDALFKSTCWPMFLAGVECEKLEDREWIKARLDALWDTLLWGYVRTAKEVLEVIWNCKDRAAIAQTPCWVDEVRKLGADLLIA